MKALSTELGRFAWNQDGATAIEYGLIAALVAVGSMLAMTALGSSITGMFNYVSATAGGAMDRAN